MPVSAAIGERLGRATHRVGVVWVLIGTLSEKKVSQKSERWHEQNDRPNQSNDQAPVPPLHPHPGNDQQSNDLEHSQENESLSSHGVSSGQRPGLRHAGPKRVNREAELEPPSRVARSEWLANQPPLRRGNDAKSWHCAVLCISALSASSSLRGIIVPAFPM